jgi:hypothetical protein
VRKRLHNLRSEFRSIICPLKSDAVQKLRIPYRSHAGASYPESVYLLWNEYDLWSSLSLDYQCFFEIRV